MDLYIQIVVVACLTGMTSLLAHRSAAVFHDGIRPILPQLIEGYMNRREAGSIAFGLSIGFVACSTPGCCSCRRIFSACWQ